MGRPTRARAMRWLTLFALICALLTPAQTALAASELQTPTRSLLAPLAPAEGFTTGSRATVATGGDGLRMRGTPSVNGTMIASLPDGTTVAVADGRVSADGYWWQRVTAYGLTGWVAEMYLRPAAAPTNVVQSSGGCPAASAPPPPPAAVTQPTPVPIVATSPPASPPAATNAVFGTIPQSGFGLVVWGGGTPEAVATASADGGCKLKSIWITGNSGEFVGYAYGAPAFVNKPWSDRFPDGLAGNTPLILVCGGPSNVALKTSNLTEADPAVPPLPLAGPPALGPLVPAANIVPAPWASPPVAAKVITPPTTNALAALVLDGSSGAVMYEKNGHLAVPPASLTKIVTAILTVEAKNLDSWVTVNVDSRVMYGSSVMGLVPGDCFKVRDLLYGLMLPSGNDAALALGRFEAGSDDAFVTQMNALVKRLNLTDSHFVNPHGLTAPGHVASAYDLALLARYAMTLPDITAVVGTQNWTAQGSRTIPLSNVNTFLPIYPGADGVKTGFTEEAGRTLVASVTKNGRRVFVVILNSTNRDGDAKSLFDWAFSTYIWG